MRRSASTLVLLALLACSSGSPAPAPDRSPPPAEAAPSPAHWLGLAPGRHVAVPFGLSMPAELGDVQQRFVEAAAAQQAWLQQYVAELDLPPGAPLPYHANFGIREAEYQRLLYAYQHPIVVEEAPRDLEVRVEDDTLRFSATGPLAALNRLGIDAAGRLHYGDGTVIAAPKPVTDLQASFGVWSGFGWRHDRSEAAAMKSDALDFDMGEVAGRKFIHLSRRRRDGTVWIENIQLLLWIE